MKILMICDFYGIGQQYQENMIAKYYSLLGHDVHIIANTYPNVFDYINDNYVKKDHIAQESDGYATIYRIPYKGKYKNIFKVYRDIRPHVEAIAPDLIYFHHLSFNLHQVIPYIKKNKQTRMIMDFHIDYSNIGQSWNPDRSYTDLFGEDTCTATSSISVFSIPLSRMESTFWKKYTAYPVAG